MLSVQQACALFQVPTNIYAAHKLEDDPYSDSCDVACLVAALANATYDGVSLHTLCKGHGQDQIAHVLAQLGLLLGDCIEGTYSGFCLLQRAFGDECDLSREFCQHDCVVANQVIKKTVLPVVSTLLALIKTRYIGHAKYCKTLNVLHSLEMLTRVCHNLVQQKKERPGLYAYACACAGILVLLASDVFTDQTNVLPPSLPGSEDDEYKDDFNPVILVDTNKNPCLRASCLKKNPQVFHVCEAVDESQEFVPSKVRFGGYQGETFACNKTDDNGKTALLMAVEQNDIAQCRRLCSYEGIDFADELQSAVYSGRSEMVSLFLAREAHIDEDLVNNAHEIYSILDGQDCMEGDEDETREEVNARFRREYVEACMLNHREEKDLKSQNFDQQLAWARERALQVYTQLDNAFKAQEAWNAFIKDEKSAGRLCKIFAQQSSRSDMCLMADNLGVTFFIRDILLGNDERIAGNLAKALNAKHYTITIQEGDTSILASNFSSLMFIATKSQLQAVCKNQDAASERTAQEMQAIEFYRERYDKAEKIMKLFTEFNHRAKRAKKGIIEKES
ncbi:MAG: hypothetical protein H6679_01960 [Epsilonproteobacteria bacterium]|nr:hypothetical protein [Campylobacterota bacterium]